MCSGVLQCSDGLSNRVSIIIRRLMDNMKLLLYEYYYYIPFTSTIITFPLRVLLSHSLYEYYYHIPFTSTIITFLHILWVLFSYQCIFGFIPV
jgi:hypothetical protein